MKLTALAVAVLAFVAPVVARADGAIFKIDPAKSSLTYKIVHKFHEVEGTSKKIEGAAAVKPGEAQVQIRTAIANFDSGNSNRDSHMKETVEESKYPTVTLKGVIKGFAPPAKLPGQVSSTLEGQLDFHGATNPISVPVTLDFDASGNVHAKAAFNVSLDAYKVERPSLVFVKIDDACQITADLNFIK